MLWVGLHWLGAQLRGVEAGLQDQDVCHAAVRVDPDLRADCTRLEPGDSLQRLASGLQRVPPAGALGGGPDWLSGTGPAPLAWHKQTSEPGGGHGAP
jgi:hypothetical protein